MPKTSQSPELTGIFKFFSKAGSPKRSPRSVMIGFAGVSALALGAFILGKRSMARRKKMELQCYRDSIEKGERERNTTEVPSTPAG
ncbi:uncharacterized protein BT62DRAFT_733889 [Guyanagaster necrorhizus]|uniref:Uncharacterized protein n=1 Tax=Guyanagaster necrorhizus TaxID=856835 RepID=A0A9P8AVA2_9AGAR|nr:uncharacterized protein BT62DRAFT_733889 [Guyanagaster necrorhizus MCA 3950]KAG7448911.1 hypothetical protein BT62DRAFT_733889 [Guyanagaster necrorhizus MCA 3950]